ncbi:M48 family metalloprotease [Streptomyces sp. SID8014]|uniref:M48 family metalloprotease n=1 Tax=Streptomyces sp. SID8014 TaxID=2706097 RepID=UPI0013BA537A|nr:M48 family metalloprotease [Streptomyces sp. SID8014]NEC12202.1 M48 family metalloprotease [Streptomyces sp. SID8014]
MPTTPNLPDSADQRPEAQPPPPQDPRQPPAYPTGPAQPPAPPAYPDPGPLAPPPAYPRPPAQHVAPPAQPAIPPRPATPAPLHAHHISTDQRRVYLKAHQRHADATALGSLLIHLPHFLSSLVVVGLVSLLVLGGLAFVGILAWLLSGLLVFHRPTEKTLARRLLRLRHPTPEEFSRLAPVWQEVTARAGVDAQNYELWIEENDTDLNAVAAAGHIVGVTTFALHRLPNGELAAVLAHELGHHVGGHAWASLLGYWYALPARLAYRVIRFLAVVTLRVAAVFSSLGFLVIALFLGIFAFATITTLYGLPLLILAAPYALAAVGRRAELRADQHAAALGFAPMLASVLHQMHEADQAARHQAALAARAAGTRLPEESAMAKLLATHPDHHTRLHHLQPWLQPRPPR